MYSSCTNKSAIAAELDDRISQSQVLYVATESTCTICFYNSVEEQMPVRIAWLYDSHQVHSFSYGLANNPVS